MSRQVAAQAVPVVSEEARAWAAEVVAARGPIPEHLLAPLRRDLRAAAERAATPTTTTAPGASRASSTAKSDTDERSA